MRVCLKDSAAPCYAPGNITAKTHGDDKVGISSCNLECNSMVRPFPPNIAKGKPYAWAVQNRWQTSTKKHEHNKIGPPKPPNKKKSQRGGQPCSSPERKYNTDTHYWKHQILTVRNVNANTIMAQTYYADASMSVNDTIWILKPYAGFDICSIWCSSIEPWIITALDLAPPQDYESPLNNPSTSGHIAASPADW